MTASASRDSMNEGFDECHYDETWGLYETKFAHR